MMHVTYNKVQKQRQVNHFSDVTQWTVAMVAAQLIRLYNDKD